MASRFLFNAELWTELKALIPKAKRVRAAVAYLGTGGFDLLPLRKGDKLLVDMSLRSVRAGSTDPREVQRFFRRGVEVFTRSTLHAKFFILDHVTVAGSSNISTHAKEVLDEAAILTDDPAVTRRASDTFASLCSEPVGEAYLKKCIAEYRPPRFLHPSPKLRAAQRKGKVWIIGGLRPIELPTNESQPHENAIERAEAKRKHGKDCKVDSVHYPSKPRYISRVRVGDWLIFCVANRSGFDVSPPAQFLALESYPRGAAKHRFVVACETHVDREVIRWTQLRASAPKSIKAMQAPKPRTAAIVDDADADAILRLWDMRGRFRPKRTRKS